MNLTYTRLVPLAAYSGARVSWLVAGVSLSLLGCEGTQPKANDSLVATANCPQPLVKLGLKVSQTQILGRSVALNAAGYVVAVPYEPTYAAADVPVQWASSTPGTLSISGSTATAVSVGHAKVRATVCALKDSIGIDVIQKGYQVTPIYEGVDPLSDSYSLNDSGQVALNVSGSAQRLLWSAGSFTDLGSCIPRAINNSAQILCVGNGPTIWQSGSITTRDTITGTARAINDQGHVLIGTKLWRGAGDAITLGSPSPGISMRPAALNNADEITGSDDFMYPHAWIWQAGTWTSLKLGDRHAGTTGVNDSGVVLGALSHFDDSHNYTYVTRAISASRAAELDSLSKYFRFNNVVDGVVSINNRFEITGRGISAAAPWLWSSGKLVLLNQVLDDPTWTLTSVGRVNNRGQIVGLARKGASAPLTLVLLDPP